MVENQANIAALWNAHLGWRLGDGCLLTAKDVAMMMVLQKVAGTTTGPHDVDEYVDTAYFVGCVGEIVEKFRMPPDD